MKKYGKITAAALAAYCLALLVLIICAGAEGELPVTKPIDITFDTTKWFVSTRISGETASKLARYSDITHYKEYGSADGWYVDSAPEYTCIVERDPEKNPGEWPKLNESTELLKAGGDYYYRIEIEDAEGYDWDTGNVPPVTVNGATPDFYHDGNLSGGGYLDVFVKAVFDEVSDQVAEIRFDFYENVVQRGTSKQLKYTVFGTDTSINWTLEAHSSGTSITPDGIITVGSDEGSTIYITAVSAINPEVKAYCNVRVVDSPVHIDSVAVTTSYPDPTYPGLSMYFDAVITGNDVDYVEWQIMSPVTSEGTTISSSGELRVNYQEEAKTITVRATSLIDPSKYGEYTVTVGEVKKITQPVEITFNVAALNLSLTTTGKEVTARLSLPETAFSQFGSDNAKNGWYVDSGTSFTCLVERPSDGSIADPGDWPTLQEDENPLSADKVYYLRIEIEDKRNQGYEWDAANPPAFTVNGKEPDIVRPANSSEAYADVFVRLDIPGSPAKTLTDLKLTGTPKDLFTKGDYFYKGDYSLIAVYDDGSEFDLTNYPKFFESSVQNGTRLTPDVTEIVFTYREGGVSKSVTLPVKVLDYFDVTFDPMNGDTPEVHSLKEGEKIEDWMIYKPNKQLMMFEGWFYKNSAGEEALFDFDLPVTSTVVIYAKYKALAEAHVKDLGSGTIKSSGAYEDSEGENVYGSWHEDATATGCFIAVPAEGYRFVEWRADGSGGPPVPVVNGATEALYYTKIGTSELYFRLTRGNYRFYAVFEEVEVTLTKIEIEKYPGKVVYQEGDSFDPEGLKVTATYSDGSTEDVTSKVEFEPAGALAPENNKITVSYTFGGATEKAEFEISVTAAKETENPEETATPGETENPTDGPDATEAPTEGPAEPGKPEIKTEKLADAVKGKEYSATIEVTGDSPVTVEIVGVLPDGLKFNASNLELYGKPEKEGTYSFIVKAGNASGSVEKAFTINVVKKSSAGKVFGVIGIVLGSLAVLGGGAALAMYLFKRKQEQKNA